MNSKQLKYAEVFSFLAFIFFLLFISLSTDGKKIIEGNQTSKDGTGKYEDKGKYDTGKYPPHITIPNAGKYSFVLGKAELTPELKNFIAKDIVPQIKDTFQKYPINTIEVIGHTDGLPIKGNSNLDQCLNQIAIQNRKCKYLEAGSNADLGLMRALAVIKALQKEEELLQLFKDEGIDKNKVFRAYSAAQLYLPDGTIAPPDPNANEDRRRIEIRFTKLQS